jgi:hypothetical protein
MTRRRGCARYPCVLLVTTMLLGAASVAHAENHALIMWIGEYADSRANLPGIDLDAKAARRMAAAMNVPPGNITELKNKQLGIGAMSQAIKGLTSRIKANDRVFLYFSGHGGQQASAPGSSSKCSEGLVAHDVQIYFDRELEADIGRLAEKAGHVVMMNDSCFSGGASQKGVRAIGKLVAKRYPQPIAKAASSAAEDYNCGEAVNQKSFFGKNFEVVRREGTRLLYIAASAANQLSFAGPAGSLATQAWAACLEDPAADTDKSGSIEGVELLACAQPRINRNPDDVKQEVTLTGTPTLMVATLGGTSASVHARSVLDKLQAGADPRIKVGLGIPYTTVQIGKLLPEFDVVSNTAGYLYLFQSGSDGKTVNLLFPNEHDTDNRVSANQRLAFPRASWAFKAAGPAGKTHLLALLSPQPKDFLTIGKKNGPFSTMPATRSVMKTFIVEAIGAKPGADGQYGASILREIEEKP